MGFWTTVAAQALSGTIVAAVAAGFAVLITTRYAARRADEQARRERALAVAAEFSRLHGEFFATWKAWELHSRHLAFPATDERRAELVEKAASVEGGFESLLVRVASERVLRTSEAAALWSLRFGFKQLRRAIRAGEPLEWWRNEHGGNREYRAFKTLVTIVATMLADHERPRPGADRARKALLEITGRGDTFLAEAGMRAGGDQEPWHGSVWFAVAERLRDGGTLRREE